MKQLKHTVHDVVATRYPDYQGEVTLDVKHERTDFDYSTPIALALAKQVKQTPREIAKELVPLLQSKLGDTIHVFTVEEAPPFINFKFQPTHWAHTLKQLHQADVRAGSTWGLTRLYQGKQVLVEFFSANPTGPATLANGRGGYCGDALANVFTFAGAEVEREYYVNDTGNQIVQLGKSIVAAQTGETIEDGYKGDYIKELAQTIKGSDPKEIGAAAADHILNHWIKPAIERMGIHYTRFFSEEKLVQSGAIDHMLALLQEHDLTYEHEGALWIRTTQYGDDKDRVIRRSDGTYTYLLTDITYHWDKIQRGFDVVITMIGSDHYTEARTLDMVIRHVLIPMHKCAADFRQPMYQFVRLIEQGQEVKTSKRAGTFVTLDDLLDRVDSDVARFFFVWNAYNNRMDFDLTLAQEASDQNPVYYIQYAYVRAKHILAHESNTNSELAFDTVALNAEERQLLLHMLEFPTMLESVLATSEVHYLAHYAIALARLFHAFYAAHPVLKADASTRAQRIALTSITYQLLQEVLALIGVSRPESMVATIK
jgi:arginyl-tRNA synthetase